MWTEEQKAVIEQDFIRIKQQVYRQFKKNPDVDACLFLIGMRELGQVPQKFTKEQKQDLMHIAVCKLMGELGYFELESQDQDGWPHWRQVKAMPTGIEDQEYLLKQQIVRYFDTL